VIIGGTSILTPRKFSSLLLALSDEKKPSRDIEAAYSSNDEDSYE